MSVFVDTSGFYAFVHSADNRHRDALEALEGLRAQREQLVTSSYVLAETMGLIQHRLGLGLVERFMDRVAAVVDIIYIAQRHQQAGWELMRRVSARHFTIVDATTVVMADELGISRCLAFDPELARQGLRLPPW